MFARFLHFGFYLGATFQIWDDILNLIGNHSYGKERDGDLWEGKRTLILIDLLQQATPSERLRIQSILQLSRSSKTKAQVGWLRKLVDDRGSIDNARRIASDMADAALEETSPAGRDCQSWQRYQAHGRSL